MTYLIAIGIFASVILFIEAGYAAHHLLFNPETQRVKRRLRTWSTMNLRSHGVDIARKHILSEMPWLNDVLAQMPRLRPLQRLLEQSDTRTPMGVFLALSALLALCTFTTLSVVHMNVPATIGGATVAACLPFLYLYRKKQRRFLQFERQFPEALDLVSRALKAGHAFLTGMKMVGEEFPPPIGMEFDKTIEEITFGMNFSEALGNLATRVDIPDVKFFVTSILVQRETGGNLTELLEAISHIIRRRFELQARVRALSAQARLSALILFALPFVSGAAIYFQSREYLSLLWTDPWGRTMVGVCGVLMLAGAVIMKRMVAIRV
ncbi:MAG: type II secretion system F family protein [Nitrospirae bacterium]|nr:MAG: type II secretion system F family protein [Nitrospirota bacterium]